ncbi:MAG: molecular chaperone DnaK [Candidatus Magasanikbacteria bacterium]|nr:molecular chaperone DnaK [Candidatus Magasanikbacteria bacterium]
MKTPYSQDFLDEIKKALNDQKDKIVRQLEQFAVKNPAKAGDFNTIFPAYGEGEDENAEEVATYDTNLQLEDTLESELRDVNGAISRIEQGTYGICKYCGNVIDEKRLRARPTSNTDVSCKKAITQEV